jgi:hypothetical protein
MISKKWAIFQKQTKAVNWQTKAGKKTSKKEGRNVTKQMLRPSQIGRIGEPMQE